MTFFEKLKESIIIGDKAAGKKGLVKVKNSQAKKTKETKGKWFESEGKLAIDLYKAGENLIIQSTIAGIKAEDLEIVLQGDIIDIKGARKKPNEGADKSYYYQECYWGPFSRQIILPEEVDSSRAEADLQEGILTIRVPCIEKGKKRRIAIRG